MSNYDYVADMAEQNALNKKRNKKKLNELLDKYGESKEAIEQNADLKDSFDYMFAHGDSLIDEVLEERQIKRVQSSFPQTPYPTVAKDSPNYVAPSNLPEMKDHLLNPKDVRANEIFKRVYAKTLKEEGGFEDKKQKIDAPTNMGIRQDTLDRFRVAHSEEATNFPVNIRDLTAAQAEKIARLDFFDKYRIAELKHEPLQETMFDAFFNHSPKAPALWAQRSTNKYTNIKVKEDGIFGSETINALNSLSKDEIPIVNNSIVNMRYDDYLREKKINRNPYYQNFTAGLPSRFDKFRIK